MNKEELTTQEEKLINNQKECKHNFIYSHTENSCWGGTSIDIPRSIDVVICSKCGKIKRTKQ